MMTMLLLFPPTDDMQALDEYVTDRLVPTLQQSPGIGSVAVSEGAIMSPGGPAPYARVVSASVEGLEHMVGFGQSATTADVRAEGERLGATVLMFGAREH